MTLSLHSGSHLAAGTLSNGFSLAIVIMVLMAISLIYSLVRLFQGMNSDKPPTRQPSWLNMATPVLCVLGIGVAFYLTYIETQKVAAFCGPIGDCNLVQSSPYARLFGVLPIGILGLIGYVGILAGWLAGKLKLGWLTENAPLLIFGMALFGTLFSLYLTYLEPFVIKAVCIWCLTSAVLITLLLLISVAPAVAVLQSQAEE